MKLNIWTCDLTGNSFPIAVDQSYDALIAEIVIAFRTVRDTIIYSYFGMSVHYDQLVSKTISINLNN